MTIIQVTDEIKTSLRSSPFTKVFLNNCMNSKFLAVAEDDKKIVGICFVGGLLNSNGIEILSDYRGKGLAKKLLEEIKQECTRRKISFLTGVFKPTNEISIKTHLNFGYVPIFTIYYNEQEGREIVVLLPLDNKGKILMNLFKIFNTRIGNILFAILFRILKPMLKDLIAFSGNQMPKIDLFYSLRNFEKVQYTLSRKMV